MERFKYSRRIESLYARFLLSSLLQKEVKLIYHQICSFPPPPPFHLKLSFRYKPSLIHKQFRLLDKKDIRQETREVWRSRIVGFTFCCFRSACNAVDVFPIFSCNSWEHLKFVFVVAGNDDVVNLHRVSAWTGLGHLGWKGRMDDIPSAPSGRVGWQAEAAGVSQSMDQ